MPPGALRRFWARHPRLADALLALHVVPLMIGVVIDDGPHDVWTRAGHLSALLVIGAALYLRRREPFAVLAVTVVAITIMLWPTQGNVDTAAIPVALYSMAVYRSNTAAWFGLAATAVVTSAGVLLWATPRDHVAMITVFCVLMLVATLIGANVGNRRRYTSALVGRAEQLERERDQQAQLAAAAERSRIAREMHDIVAHSLTVMVALAGGADSAAHSSPALAQTAMREVRDVGRSALADMRRLLGVLRDDSVGERSTNADAASLRHPQPGNDDLVGLVDGFRAAGMPVTLALTGSAPVGAGLQLTVHRIVQESLTNVLRYASAPTRVAVRVVSSEDRIEIHVSDNGRTGGQAGQVEGSGQGLIGMRERVAIYNGTLEVGPGQAGGWHVHAVLFVDRDGTS